MIPKQLNDAEFRFIPIAKNTKVPINNQTGHYDNEKDRYTYCQIKEIIKKKDCNYAVLCGFGNLLVIDTDSEEASKFVREHMLLPKTFTVKTCSGGYHFFFYCDGFEKEIRLKDGHGEIKWHRHYVIGARSTAKNKQGKIGKYEVVMDYPIAQVEPEDILDIMQVYLPKEAPLVSKWQGEKTPAKLTMQKMIDYLGKPITVTDNGKEHRYKHPIHGGNNKHNISLNVDTNRWHCFHHQVGGDVLTLVAVMEKLIDCTSGGLSVGGASFFKAIEALPKYGYTKEEIEGEGFKLAEEEAVEEEPDEEWMEDWVWVRDIQKYFNLKRTKFYTREDFNLEATIYVPMNKSGGRALAHTYVTKKSIKMLDGIRFMPRTTDIIVKEDDLECINVFNHNLLKKPKCETIKDWKPTEKEIEAIHIIERHIYYLCGSKNHETLLHFLAYIVQYMGKPLGWLPIIQGRQGCGKSTITEIIRTLLPERYVQEIYPRNVLSNFNSWVENCLMCALEELKFDSRSGTHTINNLKSLITNKYIQVEKKGINGYMINNTLNFICYTNHRDAIPLSEDDRRFWVIYSALTPELIKEELEMPIDEYFTEIHEAIQNYPDAIRSYFHFMDIPESFLKTRGRAPRTVYKDIMIRAQQDSIEFLPEAREMIAEGGQYFCEEFVDSAELFKELIESYPLGEEPQITRQHKNRILKELGYIQIGRFKIDGKMRRTWVKNADLKEEEIKRKIKERSTSYGV